MGNLICCNVRIEAVLVVPEVGASGPVGARSKKRQRKRGKPKERVTASEDIKTSNAHSHTVILSAPIR